MSDSNSNERPATLGELLRAKLEQEKDTRICMIHNGPYKLVLGDTERIANAAGAPTAQAFLNEELRSLAAWLARGEVLSADDLGGLAFLEGVVDNLKELIVHSRKETSADWKVAADLAVNAGPQDGRRAIDAITLLRAQHPRIGLADAKFVVDSYVSFRRTGSEVPEGFYDAMINRLVRKPSH